ncbi:hypothetical protein BJ508DRAFT_362879 [Ascobolus immersus RN42]|uniref:MYND-type domain-containing protein n=1 Tax=Ascobolus immersus RN42 TaxID=1160509 RepID=A0A3N4IE48_ASCIM|nr:hypothetical protein BJ508DRAFT_362879 [Ascobolus immersus RN42]
MPPALDNTQNSVFQLDPKEFVPQLEPATNCIEEWGLLKSDYLSIDNDDCVKWIKSLAALREEKLRQNRELLRERQKHKAVLKICLEDLKNGKGKTFCHRIVKVSGSMTLAEFADKVIKPAMGWAKDYHAYTFINRADGTVFGPKEGKKYSDYGQLCLRGEHHLEAEKYTLGHVFTNGKVELGFNYDLNNFWRHRITVERILPIGEPNAKAELVFGFGACPPEDMNHPIKWQECYDALMEVPTNPLIQHLIHCSENYKELPEHLTGIRWTYDPHHFNLDEARDRVDKAFGFKPKPIPLWQQRHERMMQSVLRPEPLPVNSIFMMLDSMRFANEYAWEEERKEKQAADAFEKRMFEAGCLPDYLLHRHSTKDRQHGKEALARGYDSEEEHTCQSCDRHDEGLMRCGKCKSAWYCNRTCQKKDWKAHKKHCASLAQEYARIH